MCLLATLFFMIRGFDAHMQETHVEIILTHFIDLLKPSVAENNLQSNTL